MEYAERIFMYLGIVWIMVLASGAVVRVMRHPKPRTSDQHQSKKESKQLTKENAKLKRILIQVVEQRNKLRGRVGDDEKS